MIQEVRVIAKPGIPDSKGDECLYEINRTLGIKSVKLVRTARVFRFEGISAEDANLLAVKLLAEDVFQTYRINGPVLEDAPVVLEVAYRPGVMNPGSLMKSASDLGVSGLIAADSSWEYGFYGDDISEKDIDRIVNSLLVNATIEYVVKEPPKTLVIKGLPGHTRTIPIRNMNDDELMALSQDNLFLNLEEMKVVQDYFSSLQRDPTDCEIEIIAQTWSEHCVHKTFKAKILVNGQEKTPFLKR